MNIQNYVIVLILLGTLSVKGQKPPQFPDFEPVKIPNYSIEAGNQSQDKTLQILKQNQEEQYKKQQSQAQLRLKLSKTTKTDVVQKRMSTYEQAAQELQQIIEDRQNQDVGKAVALVENVYYQQKDFGLVFNEKIARIIQLLQRYVKEKELDWKNYDVRQKTLLLFFMQSLVFSDGSVHQAPQYNHEDPMGNKDLSNTFVYKILDENKGQCYSLPLLYKVLADEIKVKASICLAPNHTYVQIKDGKGVNYNFETTGKGFPSDSWIVHELNISQTAIEKGIYMQPLRNKQTLVNLLVVLVEHHIQELGYTDFAKKQIDYCIEQDSTSLRAWSYKANYQTIELQRAIKAKGMPPPSELQNYPELYQKHQSLMKLYQYIDELE